MEARLGHSRVLAGIGMAAFAYALFSGQDAVLKGLVAGHSVFVILFFRSITVLILSAIVGGRQGLRIACQSPVKGLQFLRALFLLVAWLCYYSGARDLQLSELTTLYYLSPVLITVLAIPFLGERVSFWRWAAVLLGLMGVIVATNPAGRADMLPAALVLASAVIWACSNIVVRLIQRTDPTLNQLLYGNCLFIVACAPMLWWTWRGETALDILPMVLIGAVGAIGQSILLEGFRRASASVLAPIEYTGLLWAFVLGALFFDERPKTEVLLGASLILLAAAITIAAEWAKPALDNPRPMA